MTLADHQITVEGDIVVITLNRNVDFQTMCSLWDNVVSDYNCTKRLWDLTLFTGMPSQQELINFARYANEIKLPESYSALVAPTDILFGVMRQHQVYRERDENTTVQVFRTMEEARSWLTSF